MDSFIFLNTNKSKVKVFYMYLFIFLIACLLTITLELFYYKLDFIETFNWFKKNFVLYLLSVFLVFSINVFLLAITRRFFLSIFLGTSVFCVFTVTLFLKLNYYNEPLVFLDLMKIIDFELYFSLLSKVQILLISLSILFFMFSIVLIIRNYKKLVTNKYIFLFSAIFSFYYIESFFNYYGVAKFSSFIIIVTFLIVIFYNLHFILLDIKNKHKYLKTKKGTLNNKIFILLFSIIIIVFFSLNFNNNLVASAIARYSEYETFNEEYTNYKTDSVLTAFVVSKTQD